MNHRRPGFEIPDLVFASTHDAEKILRGLGTRENGLTHYEVRQRMLRFGHNEIATEKKRTWYHLLYRNLKDPLAILLMILCVISAITGDIKATILIAFMIVMSVTMRFAQEMKADKAAEKLKAMVRTAVSVIREGQKHDIALKCLVPGDIVHLSAGDMVPADLRLIESRDLSVDQSSLTGEAMPVDKHDPALDEFPKNPLDLPNVCFMGTNVNSGTATAVVIATGSFTRFGALAHDVASQPEAPTSFDKGVTSYTWLMIKFISIMVPAVFLINGIAKHDWLQAFLFAMAVAVGLTPELLPVIVTVNLSKGALDMSKKKVIVKRLNAIQDFGAMDVLCTDKTGTLTEGRVVLTRYVDIEGKEDKQLLEYAFLNSHFQTGLKNLLDEAVLAHEGTGKDRLEHQYIKVDEIPFDFQRRRMSVVVEDGEGEHLLICKGAVEEVIAACDSVAYGERTEKIHKDHGKHAEEMVAKMSSEGFRLVALAVKRLPMTKTIYASFDESKMTLVGFLAFLDPAKASASKAIAELAKYGVVVKILTGDNELVTRKICADVGFGIVGALTGSDITEMSDAELAQAVDSVTVFSKLEPAHKERVIHAIQKNGHVVGFLGDGINDAPALKAADVGISVNSAVDIAKESSDIILIEHSLMVLKDGVVEGRRAFGNITKYIKMTASSNFGNMFSVVGGSIFLPFLPMLPLQIIINNLLYDFSQASIPTDTVDADYLEKPRPWNIDRIQKFIFWIGPMSSIFDYATFGLMLFIFNAWSNPALFHTGWFVESLFTQTLIVHIIRTKKIPFLQSRASLALTVTTLLIISFGAWLPYSPLASVLGFVLLPLIFWVFLAGFIVLYFILAQFVKNVFIRKYGWD